MVASRLIHVAKDDLAKKHHIRIINPDRPGFGGTDAAGAENVLVVWRGMSAVKVACMSDSIGKT